MNKIIRGKKQAVVGLLFYGLLYNLKQTSFTQDKTQFQQQKQNSHEENNTFDKRDNNGDINKVLDKFKAQYQILLSIQSQIQNLFKRRPYREIKSLDLKQQQDENQFEENELMKEQFIKINDKLNNIQYYQDNFQPTPFQMEEVANSYVIIKNNRDQQISDYQCGGNVVNIDNKFYVSTYINCINRRQKAPIVETRNQNLKYIFVEDYYLDKLDFEYQKQCCSTNVQIALMPMKQNQYEDIIKNKISVEVSTKPAQHLQKLKGLSWQGDYIRAITAKVIGIQYQNEFVLVQTKSNKDIKGSGLFFGNKLQVILSGFDKRGIDQYKCICQFNRKKKFNDDQSVSAHYLCGIAKHYNPRKGNNKKQDWKYYRKEW